MTRRVLMVWIVLALTSLLAGCRGISTESRPLMPSPSSTAQETSTIVVALAQAPTTFDPADHRNRPTETVLRNIFDGLVTRDTRSGVHLELAESMQWLDDQTLDIHLRKGVQFHDGVEMTADDVVFTFERIIQEDGIDYPEPHDSPRRGLIAPLQSIERLGDYAVRMHFSTPWPPAMQMLVHQQIVPKHVFEEIGTDGFIRQPIGTGPFRFVSADENKREVILERFDDYYGGAPDLPPQGPACVKRVIFRVISDTTTRAAALLAGEVDIIQSVPLDMVQELASNANVQVITAPGTEPLWMEMNVRKPPFDDVRVRQALNYGVDKQQLVEQVFNGRAVVLGGPLSPFNQFVNKDLSPYPYDPRLARQLLAQAGLFTPGTEFEPDDEFRNIPPDITLSRMTFTLDTLAEWRPVAEFLADQYRDLGFNVQVRVWEREVVVDSLLAGERIAYLAGWGDSAFDPVGHFEAKWHGYLEDSPYGRGNYSGYSNARVNELIRLGESTADPIERQRIYDEAQAILYEEAPAVFLVLPEVIEAATLRVLNWEPASDGRINLHDVCLAP